MEFWQQLAERNGPWAVFLLLVLFFLWKWILPFVKDRMDAADAALKEQITQARIALAEATQAAREARKDDQTQFLEALAARDKVLAEHTQTLREHMDETRGAARGRK